MPGRHAAPDPSDDMVAEGAPDARSRVKRVADDEVGGYVLHVGRAEIEFQFRVDPEKAEVNDPDGTTPMTLCEFEVDDTAAANLGPKACLMALRNSVAQALDRLDALIAQDEIDFTDEAPKIVNVPPVEPLDWRAAAERHAVAQGVDVEAIKARVGHQHQHQHATPKREATPQVEADVNGMYL